MENQTNYGLSEFQKQEDEYMPAEVMELYKQRLMRWRADLLKQAAGDYFTAAIIDAHDALDIAQQETDIYNKAMCADKRRYLIAEIEEALGRIACGEYGYCELSGEPIGLRRLDCWPIARFGMRAPQRRERDIKWLLGAEVE